MKSPEVFYLHIQGEQRGPYTIPQIDHLLNSGLITEDTLFWREGLEQWQPVTGLVMKRERKTPWGKIAAISAIIIAVGILVRVFGPITVDGWREANQHEYSEKAAYWRARDVVRSRGIPKGALVEFGPFSEARVTLDASRAATVELEGKLTESGKQTRSARWQVYLQYDPNVREWTGKQAAEIESP